MKNLKLSLSNLNKACNIEIMILFQGNNNFGTAQKEIVEVCCDATRFHKFRIKCNIWIIYACVFYTGILNKHKIKHFYTCIYINCMWKIVIFLYHMYIVISYVLKYTQNRAVEFKKISFYFKNCFLPSLSETSN